MNGTKINMTLNLGNSKNTMLIFIKYIKIQSNFLPLIFCKKLFLIDKNFGWILLKSKEKFQKKTHERYQNLLRAVKKENLKYGRERKKNTKKKKK